MKIMAMTRRRDGVTFDDIQNYQALEAAKVWEGIGLGIIREIYFDSAKPCVVVILEAETVEAAAAFLDELPMAKNRLIQFDYTLLGPFTQLSHLFRGEA